MALDPTRLSSPEDCLAVYERGFAGFYPDPAAEARLWAEIEASGGYARALGAPTGPPVETGGIVRARSGGEHDAYRYQCEARNEAREDTGHDEPISVGSSVTRSGSVWKPFRPRS